MCQEKISWWAKPEYFAHHTICNGSLMWKLCSQQNLNRPGQNLDCQRNPVVSNRSNNGNDIIEKVITIENAP